MFDWIIEILKHCTENSAIGKIFWNKRFWIKIIEQLLSFQTCNYWQTDTTKIYKNLVHLKHFNDSIVKIIAYPHIIDRLSDSSIH